MVLNKRLFIFAAAATTLLGAGLGGTAWLLQKPSTANIETKVKTAEEYWAETGLESESLEEFLQPNSCQSSKRQFLACANAVLAVAQKYSATIATDGTVTDGLTSKTRLVFAEKELLQPWQELVESQDSIPTLSFIDIWRSLAEKVVPRGQESFAVGIGINGFLSVVEDPHTYILPGDYYSEVVAKSNHRSASIGLVLGRNDQNYFVKKVMTQSSAEEGGLKKGDIILEINGKTVNTLSPFEISDQLKGEVGTTLQFKLKRDHTLVHALVVRTTRNLQTVSSHVLEGIRPYGVLTINKFATGTCEAVRASLESLSAQGITGLLLDLRDNPGGQMSEAACVSGLFLGPGLRVFEVRLLGETKSDDVVYTSEEKLFHGPIAVLVNSGSASAAEILAGALQDYHRGVLVGERTFGKGSFQEGRVWSKNKKLAFFQTKGFYYLPSGVTPQLVGLEPDVKLDFKDKFALREDEQYTYPLQPPQLPPGTFPRITSLHADGGLAIGPDIVSCLSYESTLLAPEDPEIQEAHRVLNCRGIAGRGE